MYIFLAAISAVAYSLQGTLMVKFYRVLDPFSAAVYRSISLSITMLPALLFVPTTAYSTLPVHLPLILVAAAIASVHASFAGYVAYNLPVGIGSAATNALITIVVALLGYFYLGDQITILQGLVLVLILMIILLMGISKNSLKSLGELNFNYRLGLSYCTVCGFFCGAAIVILAGITRVFNPLLLGYLWEVAIAFFLLLISVFRKKTKLQKIDLKTFVKLSLAASPTLIGTSAATLAYSQGSAAVVATVISTGVILSVIWAHWLYSEVLTKQQLVYIAIIVGCIAVLKLTS